MHVVEAFYLRSFLSSFRPILVFYTPFTRSNKHRANVEQMYSKYTC